MQSGLFVRPACSADVSVNECSFLDASRSYLSGHRAGLRHWGPHAKGSHRAGSPALLDRKMLEFYIAVGEFYCIPDCINKLPLPLLSSPSSLSSLPFPHTLPLPILFSPT